MGIRQRKNHLITVLRVHVRGGSLTEEQASLFEQMYRSARTESDQDQVTAAVKIQIDGWKSEMDRHSRVLRDVFDVEDRFEGEDKEDPPALKVALTKAKVDVTCK